MNIRKITPHVSYVGVNDRTTYKFENLWSLPHGISYNSYIVTGKDKIALIDTVEVGEMHILLSKANDILKGRKIDYLVVNHMEPDHSGGIPELTRLYPDIKIIGNKQTALMLKGFYNISDDFILEIKDFDTLDLGDVSLQFILTPLVHWPETMMTFVREDNVLFSGDGFGCYGALNGGVIDSEMDTDWYFPEMYRYYSNIVGKYGKPVQMALKKTKDLDVKYICSTHGPVWHERIPEVIDIYNRMSLYEGEDGVTIVYGSMYGHTEEIAEIIAARLTERGVRNIKIHNVTKSDMSFIISDAFRYKGLIVGSPTYSAHLFPPIEAFLTALEIREVKNKVMATFGSFTWASAACKNMHECIGRMKMEEVATMDMKQSLSDSDFDAAVNIADKVADALGYA